MKRTAQVLTASIVSLLLSSGAALAQVETLSEFDWAITNPAGMPTWSWTNPANWNPPTSPVGNASYPDDPNHTDAMSGMDDIIGPVTGANLSVGLTGPLNVSLGGTITIASLKIGVDDIATTISGGTLLFEQDEPNIEEPIDDPDSDDPLDMVDELTLSFNGGNSLIWSQGNAGTVNTISAMVGSTESVEFAGPKTLTLSGGFNEVAVDTMDDNVANNTVMRSFIGQWDPSQSIESQTRLIVSGPTATVVDNGLNSDNPPAPVDIPLQINGGGNTIPEFRAMEGDPPMPITDADPQGAPRGIIDLVGGITGTGDVSIGTFARGGPLGAVVLYDNSAFSGEISVERGNVILRDDNAFGSESFYGGGTANQVGSTLIAMEGPNDGGNLVERVIDNDFTMAHELAVKGEHSIRFNGESDATNSASWVNLLPEGETVTLTNYIYTSDNQLNRYGFDGSGETRVPGRIVNFHPNTTDPTPPNASMILEKQGTGAVFIERSANLVDIDEDPMVTDLGQNQIKDFGNFTPSSGQTKYYEGIRVAGGNLHFASLADMGTARVASFGGAIGVDTGTIALINTNSTFRNKFQNHANRADPYGGFLPNEVVSYDAYESGGLMLAMSETNATIDYTSGNFANFRDMSIAAPSNANASNFVFTGTITPRGLSRQTGGIAASTVAYLLGGGSGELTIGPGELNNAGAALVVTNGGDYINPNGEDRTGLGMVRLQGSQGFTGKTSVMGRYQFTWQDAAEAGSVGSAATTQYFGTTLAVTDMAALASPNSAENLMVQGSTFRYEGSATSTNRLMTIGTAGGAIDASGSGAIVFASTSPLVMDEAENRASPLNSGFGSNLVDLTTSDDLVIGMEVTGATPSDDAALAAAFDTELPLTITDVVSQTGVQVDADSVELGFESVNLKFSTPARVLTLRGDNTGNNILNPQVSDSASGGVVGITKSDSGKWILNNTSNAYSGDTVIEEGTLGVVDGVGTLAGGTGLTLGEMGTLEIEISGASSNDLFTFTGNLDLSGMIDVSLLSGFNPSSGTFDIITTSGADAEDLNEDMTVSLDELIATDGLSITGDGAFSFQVVTDGGTGAILQLVADGGSGGGDLGDFNGDGLVDALDYAVWRENLGASASAINDNGSGAATVVEADFNVWLNNFGADYTGGPAPASTPEPTTLALLLAACAAPLARRRRG